MLGILSENWLAAIKQHKPTTYDGRQQKESPSRFCICTYPHAQSPVSSSQLPFHQFVSRVHFSWWTLRHGARSLLTPYVLLPLLCWFVHSWQNTGNGLDMHTPPHTHMRTFFIYIYTFVCRWYVLWTYIYGCLALHEHCAVLWPRVCCLVKGGARVSTGRMINIVLICDM